MAKKSERTDAAPEPAPQSSTSVLESLRRNTVGGLFAGLVIALAVGLLLSVLVPSEPNALALSLLGLFVAAAVGFTVRATSGDRGLAIQAVALVATVVGVHLMTVVGMARGGIDALTAVGAGQLSFNDALVLALATPALSVGPLLAGLVAVIIAGWGARGAQVR